MSETRDHVSIRIDNILLGLPSTPLVPTIYRIDDPMQILDQNLHVPRLVSIGPLYHGKPHLQKMERHKLRYVRLLLQRQKELSVDKYVVAIRYLEEQTRKCYADPIHFSSDEFVKMLLIDGCFIIEFIRKYKFEALRERGDPTFRYNVFTLVCDLMLMENQIPFFVLDKLFSMLAKIGDEDDLITLIQYTVFDQNLFPKPLEDSRNVASAKNSHHLLDLMYGAFCSSFAKEVVPKEVANDVVISDLVIHSATELQEAGIKFVSTESNFLDIKFDKGVIKIPSFLVHDDTESILRNLVLYEHIVIKDDHPKYISDYAFFLQCLINSSEDVDFLRLHGILSNWLGEEVHRIFKRIGKHTPGQNTFCYVDVFEQVQEHCSHRCDTWMANLRHNYFNTPWAHISFFAAVVLLLLTLTETVFSILQ